MEGTSTGRHGGRHARLYGSPRFHRQLPEASTVAKQLAAHRESESQLVRELSGTHGTGFGLVASPKEIVKGTIDVLAAAVAVLGVKAPDELEPYRGLVLDVATAVAEAKGGVKDEEQAAIDRITAALGAV